jgi:malate synthase
MADVGVEGPGVERAAEVLTPEALEFVADLQTRFGGHRDALLHARAARRAGIAARSPEDFPDFLTLPAYELMVEGPRRRTPVPPATRELAAGPCTGAAGA